MKRFFAAILSIALLGFAGSVGAAPPDGGFSKYMLAAVDMMRKSRAGLGYGNFVFTKELQFGDAGTLKATKAPFTMCVAAQLETLVEALNMYAQEKKDYSPFHFVPKVLWTRLRPLDLRGMIWIIDPKLSTGAGSAFERYGMGHTIAFQDMFPGAFLNFNRTNGTGHGVIFLGFIDKNGNDLGTYSNGVAGFKYFSAQGKDQPDGGLGDRWAFFSDAGCPALPSGKKRDCGVLRSNNPRYLAGGYVLLPSKWDKDKANAAALSSNDATDPVLTTEGVFNSTFFTGVTTDD